MEHSSKKSGDKRSSHKRFLMISLLLGIILMQVSVTFGASLQAHVAAASAVPRVDCVNPFPSNNGTSAPPAPITPGIVLINEVLSSSATHSQWNCATSDSLENAWIEIYNPQSQPFDLSAVHASFDQGPGTQSYIIHFGSIIAAHSFLVVFPFANLTFPFSLIRLVISQVVIDKVSIPSLAPDTSYARIPDGSDNWQVTTNPTIASSNTVSAITPTSQATKTASKATKTAKPQSATSTPTQTTKRKATSTQESGTVNAGTSTDTLNTGVQPTWSALRMPMSNSDNTALDNTTQQNSSPSSLPSVPSADFPTLLSKILLTLLSVAFIFALLGCWRLYQKRKSMRP